MLAGVDLSNANLSGTDLRGAVLIRADLTSADLSGANLHGTDLSGARLENANLNGANLREANLTKSNLKDAQLINLISIEGADFTDVSSLNSESAEYLASIAAGVHPATARQTAQSLKNLPTSEMAEDRA